MSLLKSVVNGLQKEGAFKLSNDFYGYTFSLFIHKLDSGNVSFLMLPDNKNRLIPLDVPYGIAEIHRLYENSGPISFEDLDFDAAGMQDYLFIVPYMENIIPKDLENPEKTEEIMLAANTSFLKEIIEPKDALANFYESLQNTNKYIFDVELEEERDLEKIMQNGSDIHLILKKYGFLMSRNLDYIKHKLSMNSHLDGMDGLLYNSIMYRVLEIKSANIFGMLMQSEDIIIHKYGFLQEELSSVIDLFSNISTKSRTLANIHENYFKEAYSASFYGYFKNLHNDLISYGKKVSAAFSVPAAEFHP